MRTPQETKFPGYMHKDVKFCEPLGFHAYVGLAPKMCHYCRAQGFLTKDGNLSKKGEEELATRKHV